MRKKPNYIYLLKRLHKRLNKIIIIKNKNKVEKGIIQIVPFKIVCEKIKIQSNGYLIFPKFINKDNQDLLLKITFIENTVHITQHSKSKKDKTWKSFNNRIIQEECKNLYLRTMEILKNKKDYTSRYKD